MRSKGAGSVEHLPLQHFESVDVSLDHAGAGKVAGCRDVRAGEPHFVQSGGIAR